MNLFDAEDIAERLLAEIEPYCERVGKAGSIRRQVSQVNDIDLVCIPRWELRPDPRDLFAAEIPTNALFEDWGKRANLCWVEGFAPDGKAWTAELPEGIRLDLYLPRPENWGVIQLIRTGPVEFNRGLMVHATAQGFPFKGGYLLGRDRRPLKMPTEREVFERLGLEYVVPEARTGAAAVRLIRRAA